MLSVTSLGTDRSIYLLEWSLCMSEGRGAELTRACPSRPHGRREHAPRRCLRPRPIAVSQDDTEQKEKQVRSLIRYATMSQFMLVPTEEEGGAGQDLDWRPQNIPGYGTRAWW